MTLIGDPHQGIYEYAGADGTYLRGHSTSPFPLTRNYRSIPSITVVARKLSGETGETHREEPGPPAGAYAVPYAEDGIEPLIAAFREAIADCGLDADRCAVLCRASALVETISGGGKSVGSGAVKTLARAAALRDVKGDFHRAFRLVAEALEHSLLESPPEALASHLADPRRHPELRPIRRSSGTSSGPATPYPALTFGPIPTGLRRSDPASGPCSIASPTPRDCSPPQTSPCA